MKKKIFHIIPSLTYGGAERQLLNLVNSQKNFKHIILVLVFLDQDFLRQYNTDSFRIINCTEYNWIKKIRESKWLIDKHKPDLIQGWMYHACLFTCFLSYKKIPIIWNIRRTDVSLSSLKFVTFIIVRILSKLSYIIPSAIIYCAHSAMNSHHMIKFNTKKSELIFNGLSLSKNFYFEDKSKSEVIELGFIGRNVAEKNFKVFIKFLDYLDLNKVKVNVSVVGRGYKKFNSLQTKYHFVKINFLGEVLNIHEIYLKIDFLFSTSITEGFPNVIAEAMSYGSIPVFTDVGDSKFVASNYGVIIDSEDAEKIYESFNKALELRNEDHIRLMAEDIRQKFSQKKTNQLYANVWHKLLKS